MIIFSKTPLDKSKYIKIANDYYSDEADWHKKHDSMKHLELCICIAQRRFNLMFTGESSCAIRKIVRLDPFEMRPHCITIKSKNFDIICWRHGELDLAAEYVNSLLVASPVRTICDLAKYDTPQSILASINDCLYKGLLSKDQLLEAIDGDIDIRGKRKIKNVLDVASEKCESALESLAWIQINNSGFLLPNQQVEIRNQGRLIGRVDMIWEVKNRKIILELDGMNKYETINDLHKEKLREDNLRKLGFEVIRATWKDLFNEKLIYSLEEAKIPKRRYYKNSTIL